MQTIAIVKVIDGKFFAKDSFGNIRELELGDGILRNDIVFGSNDNLTTAQLVAQAFAGGGDSKQQIIIHQNYELLFDSSLFDSTIGLEETTFEKDSLEEALTNITQQETPWNHTTTQNEDTTEEETAAGEENVEADNNAKSTTSVGEFDLRDGEIIDVESGLRIQSFNEIIRDVEIDKLLLNELESSLENPIIIAPPVNPPVTPPITPPIEPPVNPPVIPPVTPPITPPVEPPINPPVEPPKPPVSEANTPILSAVIKDLSSGVVGNLDLLEIKQGELKTLLSLDAEKKLEMLDLFPLDNIRGNHTLYSGTTKDLGEGDNEISYAWTNGNSNIIAGSGNDTIIVGQRYNGAGIEQILGGIANNTINAGDGDNTISVARMGTSSTAKAGSGNDTIIVGEDMINKSIINAGDGNNTISVGRKMHTDSEIIAGSGDDTIIIGNRVEKNSSINAGNGDNTISVGEYVSNSTIKTEGGDDTIIVGQGVTQNSTIDAGDGDNTISIGEIGVSSTIKAGKDNDTIIIRGAVTGSAIDVGDGDNNISIGGYAKDSTNIKTGSGDDTIIIDGTWSSSGSSLYKSAIDAGDGNNTINTSGSIGYYSTIKAGKGDDTIIIGGAVAQNSTIDAGDGENSISIASILSSSIITGGEDNDTIIIGGAVGSNSTIDLGDGENTVSIGGSLGNSTITSGAGTDKIVIGEGINDIGYGLSGTNISTGAGDDIVDIKGKIVGTDIILDGGAGIDTIFLEGSKNRYKIMFDNSEITWRQFHEENKVGDTDKEYVITDTITNGKATIKNFEKVIFSEKVYEYELSLKAELKDVSINETLSNITLKAIPIWVIVKDLDGNEIQANNDGTYTLKIDENGQVKVTLESNMELSGEDLGKIEASVTATNSEGKTATTTEYPELIVESSIQELSSLDIDLSNLTEDIIHDGIVDMKNESFDKLMITLEDVLKHTDENKTLLIYGEESDSVTFKDAQNSSWEKLGTTETIGNKEFDIYVNSADSDVQIKVEQPISDGVTC